MKFKTKDLTLIGLFTAMTVVLSQIVVPLSPVPISLSLISIYISSGLLGWKRGVITQLIYIGLGAIGLPVFALGKGGIPVLIGPTGGYILSYVIVGFTIGYLLEKSQNINYFDIVVALILGLLVCYALGTFWLGIITGTGFMKALSIGVIPFIPGDILKILVSTLLIKKLKPLIS